MADWIYIRKKPKKLSKEALEKVKPQREKIAKAGKKVGEKCKDLKKKDFYKCRHDVMVEIFGEKKDVQG